MDTPGVRRPKTPQADEFILTDCFFGTPGFCDDGFMGLMQKGGTQYGTKNARDYRRRGGLRGRGMDVHPLPSDTGFAFSDSHRA